MLVVSTNAPSAHVLHKGEGAAKADLTSGQWTIEGFSYYLTVGH